MLPAACAATALWVAIDLSLSGGWFNAVAAWVALAAAAAIGRWPERRRAGWLIFAWVLAGTLQGAGGDWPGSRLAWTVMLLALALQPPLYAHMALAYPSGRVQDRLERAFLAAAYTVSLLWELTPALFANGGTPSLIFVGRWSLLETFGYVYWSLFAVLGLLFVALVVRRVRRAPPGARRMLLPLAVAACFAAADFVLIRLAWIAHWNAPLDVLGRLDDANMLVVPVALFRGMATIRRRRGPAGDLVLEVTLSGEARARPAPFEDLTAREREVLALVAEGLTDRGIGERLWLTPKTVETHVRHILAKLRLPADARHNRRVLAARAYLGSRDAADGSEEQPG
ncbi:MAG TPA: LuxR C-terminal-related transcriptional regulator [Solirubrobacteraceae bacterium]